MYSSDARQMSRHLELELEWNCTRGYIQYFTDEIPDDVMISNEYTYVDASSERKDCRGSKGDHSARWPRSTNW
jgi:hypothetical protein